MPNKQQLIKKAVELGIPEAEIKELSNQAIQDKIAEALAKKEPAKDEYMKHENTKEPPVVDDEETKEPPVEDDEEEIKEPAKKEKEIPEVSAPQKTIPEGTERVKFTEDINNYYIAGKRITARKNETREVPKTVALYLRNGGKAI